MYPIAKNKSSTIGNTYTTDIIHQKKVLYKTKFSYLKVFLKPRFMLVDFYSYSLINKKVLEESFDYTNSQEKYINRI